MSETDVRTALRESEFMRGFPDVQLDKMVTIASLVIFREGDLVFKEGELAADVYVVVSGSVALEICGPATGCRRILTVGKGDLLGWSPVLEQKRLTATARTLHETEAVRINASQLLTLFEHDPRFGFEFMRRAALALAKRLSATRLQLLNVYGSEMPKAPEQCEE